MERGRGEKKISLPAAGTPGWISVAMLSDANRVSVSQAYMEDHLRNKDRLQKEWEALCSYQADPSSVAVAQHLGNLDKNRHAESLPCQFTHVSLFFFGSTPFSLGLRKAHAKTPVANEPFVMSLRALVNTSRSVLISFRLCPNVEDARKYQF